MSKLDINNPFFRVMARLGDLVVLSVLWLLCCLPVVTAGASTLALYAVACKMAAGQEVTPRKEFLKAFKRDWKQATATWLPMLVLLALLVLDVSVSAQFPAPWGGLLRGAALVGLLVWAAAFSWGFALLARFTYARGRDALANGLALALRNPVITLALLALLLWPLLIVLLPGIFFYFLPFAVLFGPGASALGLAYAVRPIFIKIEKSSH